MSPARGDVPPPGTASTGTLTVCAYTGFEPFVFERHGELAGADVDILRMFCAEAALELRFERRPRFDGVWLAPLGDGVDLAAAGIARFVERLHPGIAWTRPYHAVERSILVRAEHARQLRGIEDFGGHAIGFVGGSTADLDTRARAPAGARLVPVENQREGVRMLRAGELGGLAMGTPSNAYNARLTAEFALVDVHPFSQDEGLRFAVKGSNGPLLAALDAFIERGHADGRLAACFERWTALV